MRWILVLLVLACCSCGSTPAVPSTAPPESATQETQSSPLPTATGGELTSPLPTDGPPLDVEAEEYVVLSDLIQENPVGYDLGDPIVVREQTIFAASMLEDTIEEHPELSLALVDSYRSRNAEPIALDPRLDVGQDYVLMPEDEWEQVFGPKRPTTEMWSDFEERYPEASGVVFLSRVGFDGDGDTALAEMGFRCRGLCGGGGLHMLVKVDGAWKVESALVEWMS